MKIDELRGRRDKLVDEAAQQQAARQAEQEKLQAEAQVIGAENEQQYAGMVKSFRDFFEAVGMPVDGKQVGLRMKPIDRTPPILVEKTEDGTAITAQVTTLSWQEPPRVRDGMGGIVQEREKLPHFAEAENFQVSYRFQGNGVREEQVENFAARREPLGDGPAWYPWTYQDCPWDHQKAIQVQKELGRLLPVAEETLTMLIEAASDPVRNPALAAGVVEFYQAQ